MKLAALLCYQFYNIKVQNCEVIHQKCKDTICCDLTGLASMHKDSSIICTITVNIILFSDCFE
jgi:hypothetical protein